MELSVKLVSLRNDIFQMKIIESSENIHHIKLITCMSATREGWVLFLVLSLPSVDWCLETLTSEEDHPCQPQPTTREDESLGYILLERDVVV